jgi:glycosyltransferase involved in cell wall biosynthesis
MKTNGREVLYQSEPGSKPAISIVMPLFNKGREVERAIRSVLAQTVDDYELIVVNDGSTDKGPDTVAEKKDSRIRIIHQSNKGVSAARNRGIAEAKSHLIAFLDADDEWLPNFLEKIIRLRSAFPLCDVFATKYLYCCSDGKTRAPTLRGIPKDPWEGVLADYFLIASKSDPPLWTSAVAVTKKAITSVGGFPVGVSSGEDLLTWARLALRYSIAYSSGPSAYFWFPNDVSERPGRTPQTPDVVGDELGKLLNEASPRNRDGLAGYVSLWHKMRAVIFIELGENQKALFEIGKSVSYSGMNFKLLLLKTITKAPRSISKMLLRLSKR